MAEIGSCNATIAEVVRNPQTIPDDGSYYCSFCGNKALAGSFWNGPHQTVVLCNRCLHDGHILGALIGDAALDERLRSERTEILNDVDRYIDKIVIGAHRTIIVRWSYRSPAGAK